MMTTSYGDDFFRDLYIYIYIFEILFSCAVGITGQHGIIDYAVRST